MPKSLQSTYIAILHKGHMGADRIKQLASDVVYWPKMRQDIESAVSQCSACNSCKAHLQKQLLINHPVPDLPWATVGADIFDWNNHQYLVMVDSYSGWFEMDLLPDSSSRIVIFKMKRLFSTHGIPEKLLTDNGRQFVSREFELFAKEWNFEHITSSPYYAHSNGLAENAVKQAKQLLEKCRKDGSDVQSGRMGSPAQRLLSRRTRTTLPTSTKLLKPKPLSTSRVSTQLKKVRQQQKQYHDKSARHQRPLKPNEVVRMQTDKGFQRLAVVNSTRDSPRSCIVTSDGADYFQNRRHLPVSEPRPQNSQQDSYATGLQQPPVGDGSPTTEDQKQQTVPLPSMAASPSPPSTPQQTSSRPMATPLGSPQRSHAPPCSLGRDQMLSTPGHTAVPCQAQPSRQPVVTRTGRVVRPNPKYFDTWC